MRGHVIIVPHENNLKRKSPLAARRPGFYWTEQQVEHCSTCTVFYAAIWPHGSTPLPRAAAAARAVKNIFGIVRPRYRSNGPHKTSDRQQPGLMIKTACVRWKHSRRTKKRDVNETDGYVSSARMQRLRDVKTDTVRLLWMTPRWTPTSHVEFRILTETNVLIKTLCGSHNNNYENYRKKKKFYSFFSFFM